MKEDPEDVVSKHSSKLETVVPGSTTLDGEILALQSELGVLSQRQMQLDTIRPDERKIFERVKADLKEGVSGAQKALYSSGLLSSSTASSLESLRRSRVISPRIWRSFPFRRG